MNILSFSSGKDSKYGRVVDCRTCKNCGLYHSTITVMKKHKRICKSKQQNHCFLAAQDLFSDESHADVEDYWLLNEEPRVMRTPDDDEIKMFDHTNECFEVE